MSIDFNKEIQKLRENLDQLVKIDEKFKGTKQHGKQLRIFFEDIETNVFNIFNYTLEADGKPIKTKMTRMKGTYKNKNVPKSNSNNDEKKLSKKSSKKNSKKPSKKPSKKQEGGNKNVFFNVAEQPQTQPKTQLGTKKYGIQNNSTTESPFKLNTNFINIID